MARTVPDIAIEKLPTASTSASTKAIEANLTNDLATTAELHIGMFRTGTVTNVSGASVAITYYAARNPGAYAAALQDAAGTDITQTVPNGECWLLPASIAGVVYLVPKSTAATAKVFFNFKS